MTISSLGIFDLEKRIDVAFTALEKKASLCVKSFFDSIPHNPYQKKTLVGLAAPSEEIAADTSFAMRVVSSPALSALGLTTTFNTPQGIVGFEKAYRYLESTTAMHDKVGQKVALSDMFMRVGQSIGGASYILVRIADIARGFNTGANLIAPAAKALSVGTASFLSFYFLLIGLSVVSIQESNQFLTRAHNAGSSADELRSLIGELTGEGVVDPSKTISKEDLQLHLGQALRSILNEIDTKLSFWLSDERLGAALFQEKYSKFLPTVLSRMGISVGGEDVNLDALQKNEQLIQKIWAKENKSIHERIVGISGMELLQKAQEMHLYSLLSGAPTKKSAEAVAKDLLVELQKASKEQRHTMIAYLIAGSLGGVFSILSYVLYSPLALVMNAAGFAACCLFMLYGDSLWFIEACKAKGTIGEYAKPYIGFHLALGIAAIATSITLTVMTGGIFPVACIIVIGGVWIGMDLWMLYELDRREKQYQAGHLTPEKFLEELEMEQWGVASMKTLTMFHNLPKIQREAILGSLLESHKEVMNVHVGGLSTFSTQNSLAREALEEKGKRLYEQKRFSLKVEEEAFKVANETLLSGIKPLDKKSLKSHLCKGIFYKALYNEIAKDQQREALQRAGTVRLIAAVKKSMPNPAVQAG